MLLKFRSSPCNFNELVIKSMMHAKYKKIFLFFLYFQEMLNHEMYFFSFVFFVLKCKYDFLEKLDHVQFKS